jgi:hypothetical protein
MSKSDEFERRTWFGFLTHRERALYERDAAACKALTHMWNSVEIRVKSAVSAA